MVLNQIQFFPLTFPPQGTFGNSWRYIWLSQLGRECYGHLVGTGSGILLNILQYIAQPTAKNYLAKMAKVSRLKILVYWNLLFVSKPSFLTTIFYFFLLIKCCNLCLVLLVSWIAYGSLAFSLVKNEFKSIIFVLKSDRLQVLIHEAVTAHLSLGGPESDLDSWTKKLF